jgi:hypothetical protein
VSQDTQTAGINRPRDELLQSPPHSTLCGIP